MRMGYDLVLEQQQKLIMTPELRLALKILQLPAIELEEYIKQELEENPVLEIVENVQEEKADKPEDKEIKEETSFDEIDWKEYLQYQGKNYYLENNINEEKPEFSYENFITYNDTLKDYLLFQLNTAKISKKERKIGQYIIESLDDNGYLSMETLDMAGILKVSHIDVQKALKIVQGFDPPGVGATNLSECLLIQTKLKGIGDENLQIIIKEYLDDIAGNRISLIAKKLSVSIQEAQGYSDIIKNLEPKPGRAYYCGRECRYVVPDVYIEKINGEYVIIINDSYGGRLMINNYYKNIINTQDKSAEAMKFINEKLSSAVWLIKSLEQRKNTLYRVIKSILNHQIDFFEKGNGHLKTMTLKNIADEIEVHESTVSRAISGKYAQTPKGIFDIKYFFKSGVETNFGEEISSETIKKRIRSIICEEEVTKPYSDQVIADKLKKEGYKISRRTVAKYRDEMAIPASSRRRRY